MSNEKALAELTARVEALEARVAELSKKAGIEDAPKGEDRCLPGFNSCKIN
ncbi:MAG: hypothetical protein PUC32_00210 [Oscillospiraceae bacterium]|nr:hypothetical protein [Oscillospiraceae bacterium]